MHIPVLSKEVVEWLNPQEGKSFLDCTFGGGGHTELLLQSALCRVVGVDRDTDAILRANQLISKYNNRLSIVHSNFDHLTTFTTELFNGVLFDFGVSSFQLDNANRGFSFKGGPLDMRMNNTQSLTAADIVNTYTESDLSTLLWNYGEERHARRIAKKIISYRENAYIDTNETLVALIKEAIPEYKKYPLHPATRTFQALRIIVNDELGSIDRALKGVHQRLVVGGVLVVITFHSLEDRLAKHGLGETIIKKQAVNKYKSESHQELKRGWEVLTPKPIVPTEEEIIANPRARSAKLRAWRWWG